MSSCVSTRLKSSSGPMKYPTVTINGKRLYVHRLVASLYHGLELQDSRSIVMHSCDNPRCINPDHLSVGSQADNIKDCITKGRFVKNKGLRGERNPRAKLTWEQVRQIRIINNLSSKSYREIAEDFGVSPSMISGICRGFFWKE